MKTATEKLKAVNEGAMSPKEFVRQMRQEFPQHITQFNGFDDSVTILKNRGVIVEAKELKSLEDYSEGQTLNIPLEAIERGVRYELNGLGHSTIDTCSEDEYNTCKATVVKNLEKDLNHYLNLLSGESNNVDKHDKETEVKRGEGAVDTFNGLKKADLKENTIKSTMKEGVVNIYNKYGKVPGFADLLKSFFEMHGKDIDAGADIEDEFTQFIMANSNLDEEYEPGSIAPEDLYYSDKHGKIVAIDDVDDKYHDSLELVYKKGDKIEGPMDEKKGNHHDEEIISFIADTYIQNAKDGDRAYDGFRDLHISDAVQDVIGILQDPNHPLHAATKEEYAIVEKDKARGIFEEGNYDTNA